MKKQVTSQPIPCGLRAALKRLDLTEKMAGRVSYALAMAVDIDDFVDMVNSSHGVEAGYATRTLYDNFNPHGKGASRWPAPARPGAALTVRGFAAAYRDAGLPAPSATSARYSAAATRIFAALEAMPGAMQDCLSASQLAAANAELVAEALEEALDRLRAR